MGRSSFPSPADTACDGGAVALGLTIVGGFAFLFGAAVGAFVVWLVC